MPTREVSSRFHRCHNLCTGYCLIWNAEAPVCAYRYAAPALLQCESGFVFRGYGCLVPSNSACGIRFEEFGFFAANPMLPAAG